MAFQAISHSSREESDLSLSVVESKAPGPFLSTCYLRIVPRRAGSVVIICVSLTATSGQWDWLKCLRKEGREMKKKNRKNAPRLRKKKKVFG